MLLWLRNIVPKRFQLLSKLFLFVSGTHLVLLSFLFVGYKSQQAYSLEIAKQLQINADTKIMFMPFYQTTKGFAKKTGGEGGRGGSSKLAAAKNTQVKEKPATSIVSAVPTIKNKKKGAGLGDKTKNKKNKTALEKKKKLQTKKEPEKIEKKEEPKKEPEKLEEKKEVAPEKLEQKPEPEKKVDAVPVSDQATDAVSRADASGVLGTDGQDIVYVGQQEYDALGMQTYLQQELSANWQPPQGIPVDAVCEVSFTVDWQGKVSAVGVSKSSGALVYDISARSALLAMEFPEWARGKAFKITFKQ